MFDPSSKACVLHLELERRTVHKAMLMGGRFVVLSWGWGDSDLELHVYEPIEPKNEQRSVPLAIALTTS